eukprot:tig00000681_g3114.t1
MDSGSPSASCSAALKVGIASLLLGLVIYFLFFSPPSTGAGAPAEVVLHHVQHPAAPRATGCTRCGRPDCPAYMAAQAQAQAQASYAQDGALNPRFPDPDPVGTWLSRYGKKAEAAGTSFQQSAPAPAATQPMMRPEPQPAWLGAAGTNVQGRSAATARIGAGLLPAEPNYQAGFFAGHDTARGHCPSRCRGAAARPRPSP